MTSIMFRIVRICCSLFRRCYDKNKKLVLGFWFHFSNFQQILNVFKKEKVVRANLFPNLQNIQELVRSNTEKGPFRSFFDSQHVKPSKTLLKSPWEHFYQISSSLWGNMIWKISPLVKFEILVVFLNTLTLDQKYPLRDCENLQFPT